MALIRANGGSGGSGSASIKIYGVIFIKVSSPTAVTLPTSCDFIAVVGASNAYLDNRAYNYDSSQMANSVAYKGDTVTFTDGGSAVGTYTLSADGNTATVSRTNQNTHLYVAYGKFE